MLWSFLRSHINCKILVFMASCKQVRFVHESFRHLRPGVTVLALHGAMQQLKRMAVYNQFCRKEKAVLFATDIAARGLGKTMEPFEILFRLDMSLKYVIALLLDAK